jgi:hypothetical protein
MQEEREEEAVKKRERGTEEGEMRKSLLVLSTREEIPSLSSPPSC